MSPLSTKYNKGASEEIGLEVNAVKTKFMVTQIGEDNLDIYSNYSVHPLQSRSLAATSHRGFSGLVIAYGQVVCGDIGSKMLQPVVEIDGRTCQGCHVGAGENSAACQLCYLMVANMDVEKATDEKNTAEEWGLILDICDKVGTSSANAKDCLRSIMKRLTHQDPHIVMQAITLLDACANNCGKNFHLEIASRDFETEFRKLLQRSQPRISEKLKQLLKKWAEGDFKSDPQLNLIPSLYSKLKQEGMDFSAHSDMVKQLGYLICLFINKYLSLKESPKLQGSLYPSTSLATNHVATLSSEPRKVRALYDFEAAEDNEITFSAGEIIHVLDDSDSNWWKGFNLRGEGLFPSNFVTADLSAEPEQFMCKLVVNCMVSEVDQPKKSVQFSESVQVKTVEELREDFVHNIKNCPFFFYVTEQVNAMGPLIDQELERVDRKHAQLTQLSSDLVEALNLYHTLMREPANLQSYHHTMPKQAPYSYQQQTSATHPHMYNGVQFPGQPYSAPPGQYVMPSGPPSSMTLPPHFHMDQRLHQGQSQVVPFPPPPSDSQPFVFLEKLLKHFIKFRLDRAIRNDDTSGISSIGNELFRDWNTNRFIVIRLQDDRKNPQEVAKRENYRKEERYNTMEEMPTKEQRLQGKQIKITLQEEKALKRQFNAIPKTKA
uniref:Signal transducing adapter molecule 1 n=1 Tax=Timema poppense TaxID=170557 RepID=A0A7R9CTP4_TIMPO|nr:unnamed protein product [Timema poppensis]